MIENVENIQDPFPGLQNSVKGNIAYNIMKMLIPLDIKSHCKKSIGRTFDGGYVLLDKDLDKLEAIYTAGVEYDTSFEEHMLLEYP